MSHPPPRRRVSRHKAKDYWRVAVHLMESARALIELGDEEYGNAIGICLIHAVISANDAVTVNAAGVRSSSITRMPRNYCWRWSEMCRRVSFGHLVPSSRRSSSTNIQERSLHRRRRSV
jgi:hypothetical protein